MQTAAILLESLRELRSRSLFWICLIFSAVIALLLFGLLDFTPEGWRILWFSVNESEMVREGSRGANMLVRWLFGGAFIWWWLSLGAIIIALISTASIIPDFVAGGAIDMTVAKPISRTKLFLVKVAGALLFVLLQMALGAMLAYVLMGARFGIWEASVLWAIPMLTLQFFYLYAVLALLGLITRSPLASLLITAVFWGIISIVQLVSNQLEQQLVAADLMIGAYESRIEQVRDKAEQADRVLTSAEQNQITNFQNRINEQQSTREMFEPYAGPVYALEFVVPKTADIQKMVAEWAEAPTFDELVMTLQGFDEEAVAAMSDLNDPQALRDLQRAGVESGKAMRDINPWTSLGTSLGFTAIMLGLATLYFRRKDF